jgi:hypothetical protein
VRCVSGAQAAIPLPLCTRFGGTRR